MGIVAKANREANRVLTSRKPGVTSTKSTHQLLQEMPEKLRKRTLRKAVNTAGRIVVKAARVELTPKRSKTTGTDEGWSAKVRAGREAAGGDLWKSIRTTIRMPKGVALALVGPNHDQGRHGHLVEFGGFHPYWGRIDGEYEPPYPFMRRSASKTESEQQRAIVGITRADWKNV